MGFVGKIMGMFDYIEFEDYYFGENFQTKDLDNSLAKYKVTTVNARNRDAGLLYKVESGVYNPNFPHNEKVHEFVDYTGDMRFYTIVADNRWQQRGDLNEYPYTLVEYTARFIGGQLQFVDTVDWARRDINNNRYNIRPRISLCRAKHLIEGFLDEVIQKEMFDVIVNGEEVCPECAVAVRFYQIDCSCDTAELMEYLYDNDISYPCWDIADCATVWGDNNDK